MGDKFEELRFCFNPCFNGYYTSTSNEKYEESYITSFNPCFNGYYTSTRPK